MLQLYSKEPLTQVFSCKFWKISKNTHFAGAFVFPGQSLLPRSLPLISIFPSWPWLVVPNVGFPVMTTFTGLLEVISRYFDTVSETLVFMNYSFRNFRNQYFAAVVSRYNYNPLVNKSSKVLWKMFNYGVPITRKQIKRSNLLALCLRPATLLQV